MKSAVTLQALIGSRTWDKEVLMWIGTEKALQQTLGFVKYCTLDLLDLFDIENLPVDDDTTKNQLRDSLRVYLRGVHRGADNRVILVVKSIGLLARYNMGLKVFYDWFIGDFTMIILLLDGGSEKVDWPEEVRCESNRILNYFSEPGMVKELFSTNG
jgi:hypothetical protein